MKRNFFLLFVFVNIFSFSLKGQSWVSRKYMTQDCRTCISKTISIYDEQKLNNITPAILMDNYDSPTLISIDTVTINKTCFPVSFKPIDIYKYEILPGNHLITGCLRPSSSVAPRTQLLAYKLTTSDSLKPKLSVSSLYTYTSFSGNIMYFSNQIYLEFNAEEGKTYRLGAIKYERLEKWSLIVVDDADSIVGSSIDTEIDYVGEKINSQSISEHIKAANELATLYKMKEDIRTFNLILSLLNDTSIDVRLQTIKILIDINKDTVPAVLEKKFFESIGDEQLLLNSVLIIFKRNVFNEALIKESFESKNHLVREITARAVRILGNKKYVESLIKLLNDKNKSVRYEAAWSIGELGDVSVIESLKQFKKQEEDIFVKNRLNKSIKMLKKLK